jgi:hypothetical protein
MIATAPRAPPPEGDHLGTNKQDMTPINPEVTIKDMFGVKTKVTNKDMTNAGSGPAFG